MFTQFDKHPLRFIKDFLRLAPDDYQAQVYKEAGERKGRFGIAHRDGAVLLEIVCALALWRGVCGAAPSQIITVSEGVADQWHEVMGMLLRECVPAVAANVRYEPDHHCYMAYGVVPILSAVEWPDIIDEDYPDGCDIYFGEFDSTPDWVVDDACRIVQPESLLVLPNYLCQQ